MTKEILQQALKVLHGCLEHPDAADAIAALESAIAQPATEAKDTEIERLREAHEKEVENILDDAQEWAVYVIEDSAPCSLRHRLVDEINQRAREVKS